MPVSCWTSFVPQAARRLAQRRAAIDEYLVMVRLRLSDPQRLGVVVSGRCANGCQAWQVPDVFGVVPRPDTLYDLSTIVAKEIGRRGEPAEHLRPAYGVDVRVVIAAHVHPQLVVSPRPLGDDFLGHDVG